MKERMRFTNETATCTGMAKHDEVSKADARCLIALVGTANKSEKGRRFAFQQNLANKLQ